MNAARITARILAHRWRLTGTLENHFLHQRPTVINSSIKQVRPIYFTSNCRKETQENAEEGTTNITYQEFVHHLKNPSSTVIDVRNPQELAETGMIPGSINIPLPILVQTLALPDEQFKYLYGVPKPSPTDDVIFTCKMGIRSHKAILLALGNGFQRVRHYPGGWIGWEENQGKSNQ